MSMEWFAGKLRQRGLKEDELLIAALEKAAQEGREIPLIQLVEGIWQVVEALPKKEQTVTPDVYHHPFFDYNHQDVSLQANGKTEPLSATERSILIILANNSNHVIPRHTMLMSVWEDDRSDTLLDVNIKKLRNKIGNLWNNTEHRDLARQHIQTIRGIGHRLVNPLLLPAGQHINLQPIKNNRRVIKPPRF